MEIDASVLTPEDLLKIYPENVLTIASTFDARIKDQHETREALFGEGSGFLDSQIGLRHEPDTSRLYISVKWLRSLARLDGLDSESYIYVMRQHPQYVGTLAATLLRGTGRIRSAENCLLLDMTRTAGGSTKLRNREDTLKDLSRLHHKRKNSAEVDPLLAKARELKLDVSEGQIDAKEAHRILQTLKKERRLLERLKFGRTSAVRKSPRSLPKKKLPLVDYIKALASEDQLMVRQSVQDKDAPDCMREVTMDAEGTVHGLLRENARERRLFLVVSSLKKAHPDYRRDYRYTHSQTTYLKVRVDGQLTAQQTYCAVFDLKRSAPPELGGVSRD